MANTDPNALNPNQPVLGAPANAAQPTGGTASGMLPNLQQSVTAGNSKADPDMLSNWYSSYMAKNPTAGVASTTPTSWAVAPNQTVQSQLGSVLDAGGSLMDRAATRSATASAGRGMLNSSMGVQAGQAAMIDAAMPIATADANINAAAGQFNANAANSASQFNAAAANTASAAQNLAGVSGAQQQAGFKQQDTLQQTDIANQNKMQSAGFTQQQALQTIDIANQQGMQNKTISSQAALQQADIASRYNLQGMDAASRASLQQADIANQTALQKANATLQTGLQSTDLGVKQSMQQYQLAVQQSMNDKDNGTRLGIATLDANTKTTLADVEKTWRVQLQASSSMAATYQSMVDNVGRVMAADISTEAKTAQIGNLTVLYNNALGMQSKVTGLNLGTLFSNDAFVSVPSTSPGSGGGSSNTNTNTSSTEDPYKAVYERDRG